MAVGGITVLPNPPGYSSPHNWSPVVVPPGQGNGVGLNLLAWNTDIRVVSGNTAAVTSGSLSLARIQLTGGQITITNVVLCVATAGSTLTAAQCFAGVYDDQGNLIGTSADQSGSWTSNGIKTMALAGGPFTGWYPFVYVAAVSNGTTNPAFGRTTAQTGQLIGSGSTMLFAANGAGITSLPATVSYASNALAGSQGIWAGLS